MPKFRFFLTQSTLNKSFCNKKIRPFLAKKNVKTKFLTKKIISVHFKILCFCNIIQNIKTWHALIFHRTWKTTFCTQFGLFFAKTIISGNFESLCHCDFIPKKKRPMHWFFIIPAKLILDLIQTPFDIKVSKNKLSQKKFYEIIFKLIFSNKFMQKIRKILNINFSYNSQKPYFRPFWPKTINPIQDGPFQCC